MSSIRLLPASRQANHRLSSYLNHFIASSVPLRSFSFPRSMASVPSTMKAIVVHKTGGPEALTYEENYSLPSLGENEVLVKNELSGINYIDTYFRTGLYPSANGYPLIIGQEGIGEVVDVRGSDTYGLQKGDTVIWVSQGGYAEYTAVAAEKVIKLPPHLDKQDVLASLLMGLTALSLVKESYEVKKGDNILVHAAAGGVGLILCQILRDLGATVIGTASTAEKCDLAKENGAHHMINYKEKSDWVSEVKKIVPNGVDCVYDSVGATTWEGSLDASKRKGHVIYFGNASGPVPPFNIQKLAAKNTKIMRATVLQYIVTREEREAYTNMLFEYLESGRLKARVHKIYDLKDTQQAHKDLEGRLTTGKLLLKP